MTCDEVRLAAHEDLDDRLAPAARAGYAAHLAGCASCRAHRAGLSRVPAAFAGSPLEGAPPDLLAGLGLGLAAPAGPQEAGPQAVEPTAAESMSAVPAPADLAAPARRSPRRQATWLPIAGGLAAAALIAAVGLSLRQAPDPLLVAMSPSPAIEEGADAEAILTWFDAEADYVEPLVF